MRQGGEGSMGCRGQRWEQVEWAGGVAKKVKCGGKGGLISKFWVSHCHVCYRL